MSYITGELSSQPACWKRAAALVPDVATALPAEGQRVLAVGCGTSWHMAQAYAGLREAAGAGVTDAFPASEAPAGRGYDAVVAISRSGTTSEVVAFLEGCRDPSVALVGVEDSPVSRLAGSAVAIPFADERSVVQTRFATTALALLRASLGEDVPTVAAQAETALAEPLPADPGAFDHFVFLGRGWAIGIANEAALKLREACLSVSESYPAMEYRHGPVSLAGPRTLAWLFADPDPVLISDIRRTGATVLSTGRDPMVDLVSVHRIAVELAASKGLNPDEPLHLTRSVVLG